MRARRRGGQRGRRGLPPGIYTVAGWVHRVTASITCACTCTCTCACTCTCGYRRGRHLLERAEMLLRRPAYPPERGLVVQLLHRGPVSRPPRRARGDGGRWARRGRRRHARRGGGSAEPLRAFLPLARRIVEADGGHDHHSAVLHRLDLEEGERAALAQRRHLVLRPMHLAGPDKVHVRRMAAPTCGRATAGRNDAVGDELPTERAR